MLYQWYELSRAVLAPTRIAARTYQMALKNPLNPLGHTAAGRGLRAALELFERSTRKFDKPAFGITEVRIAQKKVAIKENVIWETPFCRLLHFCKDRSYIAAHEHPPLLIVAPLSGHFATLLRGTVCDLLPHHDVFITDWVDARKIPLSDGKFDLDDYIRHVISILTLFQGNVHIMAVCQPTVPVLAAVSLLEKEKSPFIPQSMILIGGPVDTRINPTTVNNLAERKGVDWFDRNVIMKVPWPQAGFSRPVYPGFLQLTGFMTMNLDRHYTAHKKLFINLVQGDGESAERHKEFYDEYLAVMDLTAEFYLQTIDTVFVNHALPRGLMVHNGTQIDPASIRNVALMTIEGELDDITGSGQCRIVHNLCANLRDDLKVHYEQPGVGHYGVFNGSKFRNEIVPRITKFIKSQNIHNPVQVNLP